MGWFTAQVTAAQITAGNVVVKYGPGRICKVLVTTLTTAAQAIVIYDTAGTISGSTVIVGLIPGATPAGTIIEFNIPCQAGITIQQNASLAAGEITVSFS
jgi:hypothetical protein